jgi:2,4-dichlorophenol 6-monooxygenase
MKTPATVAANNPPTGLPPRSPATLDQVLYYIPSTAPGAVIPHAWIQRGTEQISTLDLVGHGGFMLINTWSQLHEVADSGALLVRPDRHIAWRVDQSLEHPIESLGDAICDMYSVTNVSR